MVGGAEERGEGGVGPDEVGGYSKTLNGTTPVRSLTVRGLAFILPRFNCCLLWHKAFKRQRFIQNASLDCSLKPSRLWIRSQTVCRLLGKRKIVAVWGSRVVPVCLDTGSLSDCRQFFDDSFVFSRLLFTSLFGKDEFDKGFSVKSIDRLFQSADTFAVTFFKRSTLYLY